MDAPVGPLTVGRDEVLPPPERPAATGWWKSGPEPGEPGPAVIVGHYDSDTGPAVFYHLDRLRPGDRILVDRPNGTTATFAVLRLTSYSVDAFPTSAVYGDTGGRSALRLVTCAGRYDHAAGEYTENLVVFAVRTR